MTEVIIADEFISTFHNSYIYYNKYLNLVHLNFVFTDFDGIWWH